MLLCVRAETQRHENLAHLHTAGLASIGVQQLPVKPVNLHAIIWVDYTAADAQLAQTLKLEVLLGNRHICNSLTIMEALRFPPDCKLPVLTAVFDFNLGDLDFTEEGVHEVRCTVNGQVQKSRWLLIHKVAPEQIPPPQSNLIRKMLN